MDQNKDFEGKENTEPLSIPVPRLRKEVTIIPRLQTSANTKPQHMQSYQPTWWKVIIKQ